MFAFFFNPPAHGTFWIVTAGLDYLSIFFCCIFLLKALLLYLALFGLLQKTQRGLDFAEIN
jgi:hypothetical protein